MLLTPAVEIRLIHRAWHQQTLIPYPKAVIVNELVTLHTRYPMATQSYSVYAPPTAKTYARQDLSMDDDEVEAHLRDADVLDRRPSEWRWTLREKIADWLQ